MGYTGCAPPDRRQLVMARTGFEYDTAESVAFEGPPEEKETEEVQEQFETLYLSKQAFIDMGSPGVITVTIESGDTTS